MTFPTNITVHFNDQQCEQFNIQLISIIRHLENLFKGIATSNTIVKLNTVSMSNMVH